MIHWRNFIDQSVKSNLKIYDNIRKPGTSQGDDNTSRYFLDYPYFKKNFKLIAIDLTKQQKLDVDPKSIQQINSNGNLTRLGGVRMYFVNEGAKETVLDFSKGTVKVLWFYFILIKH